MNGTIVHSSAGAGDTAASFSKNFWAKLGKKLAKLKQNLVIRFEQIWIWAKSKSCILKTVWPTAMVAILSVSQPFIHLRYFGEKKTGTEE